MKEKIFIELWNRAKSTYPSGTSTQMSALLAEDFDEFIKSVVRLSNREIIDYTNWLAKQNLMICEGVDGYTFRSSMIGGKKYSAEELYDKFVSEKELNNNKAKK